MVNQMQIKIIIATIFFFFFQVFGTGSYYNHFLQRIPSAVNPLP